MGLTYVGLRGVWRVKISLREKCTAATFRPTGRLPGLVGSCSASHSVQIARGRLLEKQICTPPPRWGHRWG
eukprot:scaffold32706_cov62-Phaeocystis_antarctica.AAC.2